MTDGHLQIVAAVHGAVVHGHLQIIAAVHGTEGNQCCACQKQQILGRIQ